MASFGVGGGTTGVSVTAEQLQLNGGAAARAVLAQVLHNDKTLPQLSALDRVQELHRRLVPPEAPSSGVDAAVVYSALEAAVHANAVGSALLLVRALGADVEHCWWDADTGTYGSCVVHAASRGHADIAEMLLRHGADGLRHYVGGERLPAACQDRSSSALDIAHLHSERLLREQGRPGAAHRIRKAVLNHCTWFTYQGWKTRLRTGTAGGVASRVPLAIAAAAHAVLPWLAVMGPNRQPSFLVLLCIAAATAFVALTCSSPGFVESCDQADTCAGTAAICIREQSAASNLVGAETGVAGALCPRTGVRLPPRALYSAVSRRVVRRFDHECAWARVSIGEGNFINYLVWRLLTATAFLCGTVHFFRTGLWLRGALWLLGTMLTAPPLWHSALRASQGVTRAEVELSMLGLPGYEKHELETKIAARFVASHSIWPAVRIVQFAMHKQTSTGSE